MKKILWAFLLVSASAYPAPEKPKPPVVFTNTVRSAELYDLLTYPARLNPKINATILADSDGIVKEIITPLGRPVHRNQKILIMTHTDPVYDYAPITVIAPVHGVVSSVEVTEGSRVMRGAKLATITDPTRINIVVEVAVSDLSSIAAGMPAELRLAGQDAVIPVKVRGVSPFIDPATGTATCELALVQPDEAAQLPAGFVGQVTFKARNHKGIQIPEYAVIYRGKDPFVRVVENGHAKFVPITLGETRQGQVEVTKGIKEGARVVIRTSTYVGDGEEVTLQPIGAE